MTDCMFERRSNGELYLQGATPRRATAVEEALWQLLDPQVQFKDRLTAPYARNGSTICEKHDYLLAELRRVSNKPQMTALRETFFRMEQVCRAAMRDGQSLEKGLQRRGEELNNLDDAAESLAMSVHEALVAALRTTESRREELRLRLSEASAGSKAMQVFALEVEAMDREAARLKRAIDTANQFTATTEAAP